MYSWILQITTAYKTISPSNNFALLKNLTTLLYGQLFVRSPFLAGLVSRNDFIDFFLFFSAAELSWSSTLRKKESYIYFIAGNEAP